MKYLSDSTFVIDALRGQRYAAEMVTSDTDYDDIPGLKRLNPRVR